MRLKSARAVVIALVGTGAYLGWRSCSPRPLAPRPVLVLTL